MNHVRLTGMQMHILHKIATMQEGPDGTFEKENMWMMWGAATQWCCRLSYTKCSYVLSMISQAPAS